MSNRKVARQTSVLSGCIAVAICLLTAQASMQTGTVTPTRRPVFEFTSMLSPEDGPAGTALFNGIRDLVIGSDGTMYVLDGHAVRRVTRAGAVTTVAGHIFGAGSADGPGAVARFRSPSAIAVDGQGVLFVADTGNHVLRRVATDGMVSTIAGLAGAPGHANGPAREARLSSPTGLIVTPAGQLYFTEQSCVLRRLTASGVVEAVAGEPGWCGATDGTGAQARLAGPVALAADAAGIMFVAENNHTVRRVTPTGVVSTFAGVAGGLGTQDGPLGTGRLSAPRDVTVTPAGAVRVLESWYVSSTGGSHALNVGQGAIRDVAADGTLTRVRYLDVSHWGMNGWGLAYDAAGLAYWGSQSVSYSSPDHIRQAASTGEFALLSGLGRSRALQTVFGLAVDAAGAMVLENVGEETYRLRHVSNDGVVGPVTVSFAASGNGRLLPFIALGNGAAYVARTRSNFPAGNQSTVYRVMPDGTVSTLGPSLTGAVGGLAVLATTGELAVSLESSGRDTPANMVIALSAAGQVRLIAGDGVAGHVDGPGGTARFNHPRGLVVGPSGDIYLADEFNHVVRRITPDGTVTTVAGSVGSAGWIDGPAAAAGFYVPSRVALGADGSLLVQDQNTAALRRISVSGIVDTLDIPPESPAFGTAQTAQFDARDGRVIWSRGLQMWRAVEPAPAELTITLQPTSTSASTDQDVTFSVGATGAPAPRIRWQVSTDAGATWADVPDPSVGADGALTVHRVARRMSGWQYRAVVTDADQSVMSSAVTLSVSGLGVDRSALQFVATRRSTGPFSAASMIVSVTTPTSGTEWTAEVDQPWITITPGNSVGSGPFTVSVIDPGLVHGQQVLGTLRVRAAGQPTVVVPVSMSGVTAPAFLAHPNDLVITSQSMSFFARTDGRQTSLRWEQSIDGITWTPAVGTTGFVLGSFYLAVQPPTDGLWIRCVAANAAGETASEPARARRPQMAIDQPAVNFRGWRDDVGALRFQSLTAQVRVSEVSTYTTYWTIASGVPWLQVSPSSGTGAATLTLTVKPELLPPGATVSSVAALKAVRINFSSVTDLPLGDIAVHVSVVDSPSGPFGQVDTPAQGAAGVQGSIGVTGWALDDIGVSRVAVYRDCLSFDDPASCRTVVGQRLVYIGDAAFAEGARPDVQAAFPSWPSASRAGWGFLMLTSMLPHVPQARLYGGQGAMTIYAVATDVEGRDRLLGRSSDQRTAEAGHPTHVTLSNDTIARPFGAIDTPAQGAIVSGLLHNFGWVLTPDTNAIRDASDIFMPTDGSTITVYIDGIPRGIVTYNQCRGSLGPSVPAGAFCDDDVANVFGNAIPLAGLTPRTTNPSRYRNLDAGRAAIGSFTIDTTTLTNGLHTIAWGVSDSAGRNEGLGSRFFVVQNPAAAVTGVTTLLSVRFDLR